MKYFFDTEFIESKGDKAIDLISIGIVAEDGRELYYISNQFNPCNANQWVKDNVFIHLPPAPIGSNIFARVDFPRALNPSANFWTPERVNLSDPFISPSVKQSALLWQDREAIKNHILEFVGNDTKPEFWACYADYDWVVFCQLFGTMMDLPKSFPMYCRDLKQLCDSLGNPTLPKQEENEHHALADARWVKKSYEYLEQFHGAAQSDLQKSKIML